MSTTVTQTAVSRQWHTILDGFVAKGLSRAQAVTLAKRHHPQLWQRYITEANQHRQSAKHKATSQPKNPAADQWRRELDVEAAKGSSYPEAVANIEARKPGLHARYLREHNANAKKLRSR